MDMNTRRLVRKSELADNPETCISEDAIGIPADKIIVPAFQRFHLTAAEKRSCNDFFFRQHILCCRCTNKFSPLWVYSQWNKLNLLVYLHYFLFS